MNRLHVLLMMPWLSPAKFARLLAMLFVCSALIVAVALAATGGTHVHRNAFILVLGLVLWSLWSSRLAANLQQSVHARSCTTP